MKACSPKGGGWPKSSGEARATGLCGARKALHLGRVLSPIHLPRMPIERDSIVISRIARQSRILPGSSRLLLPTSTLPGVARQDRGEQNVAKILYSDPDRTSFDNVTELKSGAGHGPDQVGETARLEGEARRAVSEVRMPLECSVNRGLGVIARSARLGNDPSAQEHVLRSVSRFARYRPHLCGSRPQFRQSGNKVHPLHHLAPRSAFAPGGLAGIRGLFHSQLRPSLSQARRVMHDAFPPQFAQNLTSTPRNHPDLKLIDGEAGFQPSVPRLAVILVADMVGYSRQMAEDEAGTHARCMALRLQIIEPAAAANGARIFKYTGDGFMAEVMSATLAVWFAVKFQDVVRVWSAPQPRNRHAIFRIGIDLGDVIVEPDDVFGHTVNIAGRLQAIARPGGVLVSQAVAGSVRDPRIQFKVAGNLSLKNISEPVRCFYARLSKPARPLAVTGEPLP